MDSLYGTDRKLGDLEDSGVTEFLLDQDIFPSTTNMFQVLTSSMKDPTKCEPTDRATSPELFNWCPEIKLSSDHYVDNDWFNSLLEDPVLNDKMITDAVQSPRITSDHSYSLNNDQTLASLCKMDDFGKDMDTDIFDTNHGALDLSQKNYAIPTQIIVKQEPSSSSPSSSSSSSSSERERIGHNSIINNNNNSNSCSSSSNNSNIITATLANITNSSSIANSLSTTFTISSGNHSANNNNTSSNLIESPFLNNISETTSNIQPPAMIFTTTSSSPPSSLLTTEASCPVKRETPILPNISIKSEPTEFMDTSPDSSGYDSMNLPPTPPSSNTSDSEGSLSPPRSAPSSPVRPVSSTKSLASNTSKHISQPLFTSPIPQSGYLVLSEEEKRTLIAEGYPIPGKLPLTKQEEKNLKKIRRKIKNKISAQESRRKKKEYLETLEKQVEAFTQENVDLKKKVDSLENNNRSLIGQLQKLQAQCGKLPQSSSASSTQTGTVLMVVVLSFAVFLGSWAPTSLNIGYSSPSTHPGIFYSYPRPMHPSPSMGPSIQNVRVADYQSGSIKSRVLVSVRDELENDAWFGPNVPMKNTAAAAAAAADQPEVADSPQNTNKSVAMETKPFKWQLPSFKIPYIAKSPPPPPPPSNTSPFELAFFPVTKKGKVSFTMSKFLPDLRDLVESLPNLQLENNISSVDRGKPLVKTIHTPS